jgi:hypothetical protein
VLLPRRRGKYLVVPSEGALAVVGRRWSLVVGGGLGGGWWSFCPHVLTLVQLACLPALIFDARRVFSLMREREREIASSAKCSYLRIANFVALYVLDFRTNTLLSSLNLLPLCCISFLRSYLPCGRPTTKDFVHLCRHVANAPFQLLFVGGLSDDKLHLELCLELLPRQKKICVKHNRKER